MFNSTYKIYQNAISLKTSMLLFKHFVKVCKFFCPKEFNGIKFKGWEDKKLNDILIEVRKNKKLFSNIYNSLQISHELQKIMITSNLQKIAENFLNTKEEDFVVRNLQLRIDPPKDNRNTYGWHQDNAYYNYNVESKNGAVLWIPLVNTDNKNGSLIIKIGSENSSTNCSSVEKKKKKFGSEQILVKPFLLKKYKTQQINMKKNNALVIHGGTFHKSGINLSKKNRFSIILRFNKLFSNDFLFYRNSFPLRK